MADTTNEIDTIIAEIDALSALPTITDDLPYEDFERIINENASKKHQKKIDLIALLEKNTLLKRILQLKRIGIL